MKLPFLTHIFFASVDMHFNSLDVFVFIIINIFGT